MAYGDCIERLISLLSLKMVDECMWAAIQAEAPDTGSIQLTESHPRQTVDMSRLVTDLMVAGQLALRTLGRRMRVELESPPDLQSFRREMDAVLVNAPATLVREYRWVHLPADRPPWLDTGLELAEGEELSYFAAGRVYANRFLDIHVNPALQLWCKVGDVGVVFRGTRDSHSFRADHSGRLMFGNYFPNDWADPQGARKQSDDVYRQVCGELRILVIRWAGSALEGLRVLAVSGDLFGYLRAEIDRIEQGDTTPAGWRYLWQLGPAEIYRERLTGHGHPGIHCRTHADVGILQKDVDVPLTAASEISWRWCVERLPSSLREDTLPSHDYLSLAVEFDNGRDITYYWSSKLPVGTGYDCPLPNWAGREFHVVVRSGAGGLAEWHDERRNLHADYRRYMGEPPARIVRVWLIANSVFQRGEGICEYADIVLHGDHGAVRVL